MQRRWIAAALVAVAVSAPARAQHITIDGRFSPAQTLVGPNYAIGANLGKQVGGNLFQSFGLFNLSSGEGATFTGPATVSNVIGRVTGGSTSSINGAINSTISGANVYLINPAGIVFGPNATINVSGGFHAASADYLKLQDGAKFQATNPDGSTLSAAAPAAFGFLNATPGAITVNGSTLGVPQGQTLGLAGGTINVTGAALQAPAGTIHVTSVASTGEVPVAPGNVSTVTAHGAVNITQGASLDDTDLTGLGSGGSVFIHAGNLTIDKSTINAANFGAESGGIILLSADNQIALSDNADVQAFAYGTGKGANIVLATGPGGAITIDGAGVGVGSTGSGNAGSLSLTANSVNLNNGATAYTAAIGSRDGGPISVSAQSMNVLNGATVSSLSSGSGSGGNLSLAIGGALSVTGNPATAFTGITASNEPGSGNAGNVTITAASLTIAGGEISSGTNGAANSGNVSVAVSGPLSILGEGGVAQFLIGIAAQTNPGSTGNAGATNVSAETLSLLAGAQIGGTTFGAGNAGSVNVNVAGLLSIDGTNANVGTGIFSAAEPQGTGNGGPVTVTAGALSAINSGTIITSTFGPGNAGTIAVSVAGAATFNGAQTPLFVTGITSDAEPGSTGNAGAIKFSAGSLSILDSASISSSTNGAGNAQSISVNVVGALTIDGSLTPDFSTGIFSQANSGSLGNAGTIAVNAGSLTMLPGGTISSTTFGPGDGGSLTVAVAGPASIQGGNQANGFTGIASEAAAGSSGDAGSISFGAGSLTLESGGVITSSTFAGGNAGVVSVAVAGQLSIDGASSGIVGNAVSGSTGDAGQVNIVAGGLAIANGGEIATDTAGPGAGGDIDLMVGGNVLLSGVGPQITAASTGSGDAGSIRLAAANITLENGASISTQAGTANGGDITLSVADFLYLVSSKITTSVLGANGNGGNITIDPQLLVLDHSDIIAQAVAGHGGNITIAAGDFIASPDSVVSASSQLGISGTIELIGPRVDLNGSLVVLSSELRDAAEVLRSSCDAGGRKKRSRLVDKGPGGLPQDTETTIPALYVADRDIGRDVATTPGSGRMQGGSLRLPPVRQTAHLTMGCG